MNTLNKPKFSVIMANYNNGQYIDTAIKSVINQTFSDWELLICDDASTDDSLGVIEEFLNDDRIRLIKNEYRLGFVRVLKKLIENAESEIVGILDSDDCLTLDAIEQMFGAYFLTPEAGYIDSQLINCDEFLSPIFAEFGNDMHSKEPALFRRGISGFRTFKRNVYFMTSGFDERLISCQDDDIIFKLEEIVPIDCVNKVLYMYRLLPYSLSHSQKNHMIGQRNLIWAKYMAYQRRKKTKILNLPNHHMLFLLAGAIEYCQELNEYYKGVVFALRAVRIAPFRFVSWKIFYNLIKRFAFNKIKSNYQRVVFPIFQFQCGTGNILEDRIICLPLRHNPGHCLFGPDYMILSDGYYKLIFEMKIDESFNEHDSLVEIDCYDNMITKQVLASSSISKASINKSNLYTLEFKAYMRQRLEFRVWWHGQCRLQIYKLFLEKFE